MSGQSGEPDRMRWIAPNAKDIAIATLEKRLWDAAVQFRAPIRTTDFDRTTNYADGSECWRRTGGKRRQPDLSLSSRSEDASDCRGT